MFLSTKIIYTLGVFGPFLTDFLADCGPFEVIFWATTGETGTGAVLEPPRTRPAQPLLNYFFFNILKLIANFTCPLL
jgi:hypothetical protein